MPNDDEFEDLQAKFRQSGAVQLDRHTYRTNEGTVVAASPADIKRLKLSERIAKHVPRNEKWALPGTIEGAPTLHGEPDEDETEAERLERELRKF